MNVFFNLSQEAWIEIFTFCIFYFQCIPQTSLRRSEAPLVLFATKPKTPTAKFRVLAMKIKR